MRLTWDKAGSFGVQLLMALALTVVTDRWSIRCTRSPGNLSEPTPWQPVLKPIVYIPTMSLKWKPVSNCWGLSLGSKAQGHALSVACHLPTPWQPAQKPVVYIPVNLKWKPDQQLLGAELRKGVCWHAWIILAWGVPVTYASKHPYHTGLESGVWL